MTTICHDHDTQHRHLSEGSAVHRLVAQTGHASPVAQTGHASPVAQTGHASPVLGTLAARDLPCREHPADLWFAELPEDVELAKKLCLPCPLREVCLAGALERREPWGVWGGQLVLQGRVVPRKRPRGRPRKDEVAA